MSYNVTVSGTDYEGITKVELPITGEDENAVFYANGIEEFLIGDIVNFESDIAYTHNSNTIRAYAFYGCTSLESVSVPNLTSLLANVFEGCTALKNVNAPKLFSFVAGSVFLNCTSLEEVNFPLLQNVQTKCFHGCSALKKVDILGGGAINANAFSSTALETLIIRSTTMSTLANTNAMLNNPIESGTGYIYVPSSLIDSYKSATNWSTYASQFRAIEDYPDICG